MQLLSVIAFSVCALFPSFILASFDCDKASLITRDIFQCANIQYERIDRKLNEQYSTTRDSLGPPNKNLLLEGERAWVKHRDSHCNNIYNSIFPGEEAGIEKVGCLITLTSARLVELLYLDTGSIGDGFYNSLSLTSSLSSKTRDQILLHIERSESTPKENEYYRKNCELTKIIHAEDGRFCRARMKFQSM